MVDTVIVENELPPNCGVSCLLEIPFPIILPRIFWR